MMMLLLFQPCLVVYLMMVTSFSATWLVSSKLLHVENNVNNAPAIHWFEYFEKKLTYQQQQENHLGRGYYDADERSAYYNYKKFIKYTNDDILHYEKKNTDKLSFSLEWGNIIPSTDFLTAFLDVSGITLETSSSSSPASSGKNKQKQAAKRRKRYPPFPHKFLASLRIYYADEIEFRDVWERNVSVVDGISVKNEILSLKRAVSRINEMHHASDEDLAYFDVLANEKEQLSHLVNCLMVCIQLLESVCEVTRDGQMNLFHLIQETYDDLATLTKLYHPKKAIAPDLLLRWLFRLPMPTFVIESNEYQWNNFTNCAYLSRDNCTFPLHKVMITYLKNTIIPLLQMNPYPQCEHHPDTEDSSIAIDSVLIVDYASNIRISYNRNFYEDYDIEDKFLRTFSLDLTRSVHSVVLSQDSLPTNSLPLLGSAHFLCGNTHLPLSEAEQSL